MAHHPEAAHRGTHALRLLAALAEQGLVVFSTDDMP